MEPTCGSNCGITRERDRQKEAARVLARRICEQPLGAWDEESPFAVDEPASLARALAEALPCQVHVSYADGRGADWINLVATLSPRSWFAAREALGDAPDAREETVLRVGLSPWGRYATLQESRLRGERDGDGWWIEEDRLAGVEDRRLAMFVKAAQGVLRARKIVCLDAAFLSEPADGERSIWQALFDLDPMVGRSGVWVPSSDQRSSMREPARSSETL
ncbi:MAG: hypothetical protein U0326_28810 [Polyangiales bacterium]